MDVFQQLFNQLSVVTSDSVIKVITAAALILLFLLIGYLLKWALVSVLDYLKIGRVLSRVGLDKVLDVKVRWSELLGDIVQWAFIIMGLLQALTLFPSASQVQTFFDQVLNYLPNVFAAIFIVLIAAVVADLLSRFVENMARTIGASTAAFLSDVAKYAVIIFGFIAALDQLKIGTNFLTSFVNNFFLMFAIAVGLAFGLGGQYVARDVLDRARSNWPKGKKK